MAPFARKATPAKKAAAGLPSLLALLVLLAGARAQSTCLADETMCLEEQTCTACTFGFEDFHAEVKFYLHVAWCAQRWWWVDGGGGWSRVVA